MKVQNGSRFLKANIDKELLQKITSKNGIVTIIVSEIPALTLERIADIKNRRGNRREELLPEEYKKKRTTIAEYKLLSSENGSKYEGGVWLLIGSPEESLSIPINVGQSLDIKEEILGIAWDIMIKQNGPYYDELQKYKSFSFYEVDSDEIIRAFIKESSDEENELKRLQEAAYKMAKDYFAEVLTAHGTAAKNWNCYSAGIDSRFISWLQSQSDEYKFDRSRNFGKE